MPHFIKIVFPEFREENFYFKGRLKCDESNITVYVTKLIKPSEEPSLNEDDGTTVHGHLGSHNPKRKPYRNYLEMSSDFEVRKLYINNVEIISLNCVVMLYDYYKSKESQIDMNSSNCTEDFSTLKNLIQNEGTKTYLLSGPVVPKYKWPSLLTSSMSAQHLLCYINLFHWVYTSVVKERKFQIKQTNYLISLLMDLALGYLVLLLISQYDIELSSILMGILEKLVNSLHSLLKWLMGAPAGLKLNNAFNKMLGKYFSYHIQLWWLFLDVSSDKLDTILHVYKYLGYLGVTFQAAMICDMICVATFHSYCIYVYAARLFNIQISGLIALMRLFFGRKYNPLRGGIDSCEYTNQELFVGTVAFTILLLLLPTTTMYYIVFTLFRLLSLAVQYALAKFIQHGHTVPLYITLLWLVRSPKVAGNILMEVVKSEENSPLVLKMRLQTKPLQELIQTFKPPIEMCKPAEKTNLLSNILTGKQIV